MKHFNAALFATRVRGIQSAADGLVDGIPPTTAISDKMRLAGRELCAGMEEECAELGLTLSTVTVVALTRLLDKPSVACGEYHDLLEELLGRLRDETRAFRFFSITEREADFYYRWWLGWEPILERFSATYSDVEEASKCFALARYAAAVFHSTQVIEAGLVKLGKFMKIRDPKSGFTAVCNELKKVLDKKYDTLTDFEKINRTFFEQVYGTAEALKNAWRNKISHTQGRLALLSADFTPEIAEEIILGSRAFMRRLATDLPVEEQVASGDLSKPSLT